MTEIHLREFHYPDDYPAVRLLWENSGSGIQLSRSDEADEIQKKLKRDPDLFLVAEDHDIIVGTVIGGFDGRRGMIYHLAVTGSYREQGIGSMLMEELEHRLRTKGCLRCYLMVTTENDSAMRFYKKHGWAHMDNVYTYGKVLA